MRSKVDVASWAVHVSTPMVLVEGILLVHIDLEEAVVTDALVVLVPT